MDRQSYSRLFQRITRLRWQAPILAFILVLAHQLIEHTLLIHLPRWQHFATQLLFYGAVGPALAWWALTSLRRSVRETELAEQALKKAHNELQEVNRRLEFLIRVNRRLAEAEDDEALIETMLELPLDVLPAAGCSLVRYDEHMQPMLTVHHGDLSPEAFTAWERHLSAADAGQVCANCSVHSAADPSTCPLILPVNEIVPVGKVFCLELVRGQRKYGMLNIYLSDPERPTHHEAALLEALADEMSLALESVHLRSRELSAVFHFQQARRTKNLHKEMGAMLDHIIDAFEIDGGVLFLTDPVSAELNQIRMIGEASTGELELVKGLAGSIFQTDKPFIISDFSQEQGGTEIQDLRSLLISPLRTEGSILGAIVLWDSRPNRFARRHIRLLGTVAGQAALLIENHRLYILSEHQAALEERTRLAREIHDGLAQNLGYLQLRIARMQTSLVHGEMSELKESLDEIQTLVDGAYRDAREAIDGLRIRAEEGGFDEWIQRALAEFRRGSSIQISATPLPDIDLPVPVQIQLLRIVQEALENIRRHSACTQASVSWKLDERWLSLHISDNGGGFDAEDVSSDSQHGLNIMRERAELLEAYFQIISRPGEGTQIVLKLPVGESAGENIYE